MGKKQIELNIKLFGFVLFEVAFKKKKKLNKIVWKVLKLENW